MTQSVRDIRFTAYGKWGEMHRLTGCDVAEALTYAKQSSPKKEPRTSLGHFTSYVTFIHML